MAQEHELKTVVVLPLPPQRLPAAHVAAPRTAERAVKLTPVPPEMATMSELGNRGQPVQPSSLAEGNIESSSESSQLLTPTSTEEIEDVPGR